ncbi:biogenesis of lysosome-related organelles complex 1 subunit 6 isoform X2 [Sceloporus undulatus]|uniref:biogenesis of lysosome-related organelles complex 1 subunit 6 isoform X2 n=1 Tax=Sceloporus undulatus TaxID=8520 RepID=UPI001C4C123F|nr:biogenesis of lysosome-related organelles complex 1 subunit 6 isoform X2 [Sceloporus undulatus]
MDIYLRRRGSRWCPSPRKAGGQGGRVSLGGSRSGAGIPGIHPAATRCLRAPSLKATRWFLRRVSFFSARRLMPPPSAPPQAPRPRSLSLGASAASQRETRAALAEVHFLRCPRPRRRRFPNRCSDYDDAGAPKDSTEHRGRGFK